MRVFNSLEKLNMGKLVVALGNFDGVHKGHAELLKRAAGLAKEKGLLSCVFTFSNLPASFIMGEGYVKALQSCEDKLNSIADTGIDIAVCIPFGEYIKNLSSEEFAEKILADILCCDTAVCGFNYSFGKNGSGRAEDLKLLGEKYGFNTCILDEYKIDGKTVSSSFLRELLTEGNVKKYAEFCGRSYSIFGSVIGGTSRGRELGFPTANLELNSKLAAPKNGVYITKTYVDNMEYQSITNVGTKPTAGNFEANAETHIFGFNADIYGKSIAVEFVDYIRKEKKFKSMDELKIQIAKDCDFALHYSKSVV